MANTAVVKGGDKNLWGGGVSPMKASYGKLMMWFFLVSDAFTFTGLLIAYGHVRFKHLATLPGVDTLANPITWPTPEKVFKAAPFMGHADMPLVFVGIMTFILIMSSVTMVLAVEAGQRMDKPAVEKWMLWTILGGITFLGCQAWEWSHFIHGTESLVLMADGTYAKIVEGISYVNGILVIPETGDISLMLADKSIVEGEHARGLLGSAKELSGANLVVNEYGPPAFADFFFFITGFHGTHVFSGILINIIIFYQVSVGIMERRGHYEMVEKVGLYWHFVDLVWVFVFTFFYLV